MHSIIRNILVIFRYGIQYRSVKYAPFGIKACQSPYLIEICANPGISQDGLAHLVCLNKSNVARQVAILEEEGFLFRRPSPTDKRVTQVYPTEKAMEVLPKLLDLTTQWQDFLTQDLTAEEIQLLAKVLDKMRLRAKEKIEHL